MLRGLPEFSPKGCGSLPLQVRVARRSKIHEGYSSSSRLAAAPKSLATHPFPIYEMGCTVEKLLVLWRWCINKGGHE